MSVNSVDEDACTVPSRPATPATAAALIATRIAGLCITADTAAAVFTNAAGSLVAVESAAAERTRRAAAADAFATAEMAFGFTSSTYAIVPEATALDTASSAMASTEEEDSKFKGLDSPRSERFRREDEACAVLTRRAKASTTIFSAAEASPHAGASNADRVAMTFAAVEIAANTFVASSIPALLAASATKSVFPSVKLVWSKRPKARVIHNLACPSVCAPEPTPSTPRTSAAAISVKTVTAVFSATEARVSSVSIPGGSPVNASRHFGYLAVSVESTTEASARNAPVANAYPPNESVSVQSSSPPKNPSPFASRNAPHSER